MIPGDEATLTWMAANYGDEMAKLADEILNEPEIQIQDIMKKKKKPEESRHAEKEGVSISTIQALQENHRRIALAFSGGSDSMVLLELSKKAGISPVVIWADSQMEYPETREFIKTTVAKYGFDLRIAKAAISPLEHWRKTGWPMLGKRAARIWNQQNKGAGFKCNVSECCRTMKILPARRLTRNLGCSVQITGQRGQQDDNLRGMRTEKDGMLFYQVRDKMWISNPLTGWTDIEIKKYTEDHNLPEHPAKGRKAKTIGCVYCGGGAQFTNSGYRILRKSWPEAWHRFMFEWGGGLIILALKYKKTLPEIREFVHNCAGLEALAAGRPWLFDFTRKKPLMGYEK